MICTSGAVVLRVTADDVQNPNIKISAIDEESVRQRAMFRQLWLWSIMLLAITTPGTARTEAATTCMLALTLTLALSRTLTVTCPMEHTLAMALALMRLAMLLLALRP